MNTLMKSLVLLICIGAAAGTALAEPGAKGAPSSASETFPQASTVEGVVNLNTATAQELEGLPGVGATRAEAILNLRKQKPFEKVEDVMRVKGIGRATFRKLRPHLAVSGPTTLKAASKGSTGRAKPAKGAAKP